MSGTDLVDQVARIIEPDAWAWNVWNIWPTRKMQQAAARAKAQRIIELVLFARVTDELEGVSKAAGEWLKSCGTPS